LGLSAALENKPLEHTEESCNNGLWVIWQNLKTGIEECDATESGPGGVAFTEHLHDIGHNVHLIGDWESFEIEMLAGELSPVVTRQQRLQRLVR
jgi:hypothetical protein